MNFKHFVNFSDHELENELQNASTSDDIDWDKLDKWVWIYKKNTIIKPSTIYTNVFSSATLEKINIVDTLFKNVTVTEYRLSVIRSFFFYFSKY